jgi:hypothetical protein
MNVDIVSWVSQTHWFQFFDGVVVNREIVHCDLKPENVMLKNMTSPQVILSPKCKLCQMVCLDTRCAFFFTRARRA